MAISPDFIVNVLARQGRVVTITEAQAALAGIDQSAIEAEEKSKFKYEVWDKKSDINGVSAKTMLARSDVDPNAEIYLIRDTATNNVIYFQPHAPQETGFVRMDGTSVHDYAKKHLNEIAIQRANMLILNQALKRLANKS
ncbi:MAG: hypothetical protein HPY52_11045 [Firmicutes bacterium]|nr:hypothetical protein [Bacillota bacterium]